MRSREPRFTIDFERECFVFRLPDGLPVYTHYSFLFTALFITAPLWFQGRLSSIIVAFALMALLHLSILAHELGHVFEARRQHARAREIEIYIFGGHAALEWDTHRGLDMRRVALAGPVVNFALAAMLFAIYWMATGNGVLEPATNTAPFQSPGILSRTLFLTAAMNLILGIVNLLPAVPLDGGVIMQELLSPRLGQRRATLIVACCGVVLGCVSAIVALMTLLLGMPILAPPSLRQNLAVARENWRGGSGTSAPTRTFANSSKVVTFRARPRKREET